MMSPSINWRGMELQTMFWPRMETLYLSWVKDSTPWLYGAVRSLGRQWFLHRLCYVAAKTTDKKTERKALQILLRSLYGPLPEAR